MTHDPQLEREIAELRRINARLVRAVEWFATEFRASLEDNDRSGQVDAAFDLQQMSRAILEDVADAIGDVEDLEEIERYEHELEQQKAAA
ncbi:MAG: hypothetical protein ACJ752_00620 [Gaiellaceae bacterium]